MGEMSERCQNVVELECQPVLANVAPCTRSVLIPYVWWWISARQEHKNNTKLATFGLSWPMFLLVLEMCWICPRQEQHKIDKFQPVFANVAPLDLALTHKNQDWQFCIADIAKITITLQMTMTVNGVTDKFY